MRQIWGRSWGSDSSLDLFFNVEVTPESRSESQRNARLFGCCMVELSMFTTLFITHAHSIKRSRHTHMRGQTFTVTHTLIRQRDDVVFFLPMISRILERNLIRKGTVESLLSH